MKTSQSLSEWQHSCYLYEESLFFYALINFAWYCIGGFVMGFYFPSLSANINAWLDLLWFLCICVALCFPAFWYRLLLGKNAYLFREARKIDQLIDKISTTETRATAVSLLREQGQHLLNLHQRLALGFLFMVMLFDIFYSVTWVKNGILIWQPEWVLSCIEWVKSHLNMPHISEGWDIFYLDFDDSSETDRWFRQEFGDEFQFLQHPISNPLLFYHFIRTVLFVPIVAATCIVLWQPLQFMGNSDKDPSNIRSIGGFIRACAWSIVMGFFLIVFTWMLIFDVTMFFNFINKGKDAEIVYGAYLLLFLFDFLPAG